MELFKKEIARALEDDLVLAGSFCLGQCNRTGVTVQVDDDIYSGVTRESFPTFLQNMFWRLLRRKGECHDGCIEVEEIQL